MVSIGLETTLPTPAGYAYLTVNEGRPLAFQPTLFISGERYLDRLEPEHEIRGADALRELVGDGRVVALLMRDASLARVIELATVARDRARELWLVAQKKGEPRLAPSARVVKIVEGSGTPREAADRILDAYLDAVKGCERAHKELLSFFTQPVDKQKGLFDLVATRMVEDGCACDADALFELTAYMLLFEPVGLTKPFLLADAPGPDVETISPRDTMDLFEQLPASGRKVFLR